jgi:two-component system copper resistance phosphate regulon response regulator CusR
MKILVVEDELKTASLLKMGLDEEGYNVAVASDGEEGLARALTEEFDLLILDVMLPKKDGVSLLAEARAKNCNSLALFLTAKDTTEDRIQGFDAGGDAYIVKPFAFAEVLANIRSLQRRLSAKPNDVVSVADLEIVPMRQTAFRRGQKLDLSAKEFSLLALLMTNKNQIMPRSLISEIVWGV